MEIRENLVCLRQNSHLFEEIEHYDYNIGRRTALL